MFKSRILDTLVFKDSSIHLLGYHIDRTYEAYQYLNLSADKAVIASIYREVEKAYNSKLNTDECLRLIFSDSLPVEYTAQVQKIKTLHNPVRLKLHALEHHQNDLFQFKWENRKYWDDLMQSTQDQKIDDLLLINPGQQLVETTRFNIFAYNPATNMIYTPSLSSGCLNGTYRRYALAQKQIELPAKGLVKLVEKNILLNELGKFELYVANSVRGVLKTKLLTEA